jgi:hypothetical protein
MFNAEDLLACADTCKAGPQGHDKHACVHVPVLPFCFSLLVMDGLAEHLLYELQARWKKTDDDYVRDNQLGQTILEDMRLIFLASGTHGDIVKGEMATRMMTETIPVSEFLRPFAVGTEKRKHRIG